MWQTLECLGGDHESCLGRNCSTEQNQPCECKCHGGADRIQARAIARAGDILKQIEKAHGVNQNISDGDGTKVLTRKDAAKNAGMSKRQYVTAMRVANIPEEEFEQLIESEDPPTVTGIPQIFE